MLVSSDVPSIANGVSQQPAAIRLPSQLEALENCLPSIVEGVKKRPPRELVKRLTATVLTNFHTHWINRDATERYCVVITNGDLRVFDLNGNEKTVNFPDGKTYLAATTPEDDFRCVSVIDYTFIVNKTKTVTKTVPTSPPVASSTGMVYVKAAGYSVTYKVFIDGVEKATYTTPAASGADTDAISNNLLSALTTSLGASWTISRYGSVLKLVKNDGSAFQLQTKDSVGDSYLYGFTDRVQRFEYLPQKAFDGYTVEVFGDPDNGFDSYYVRYDKANNTWVETVNPRDADVLTTSTMPHILVRETDGTFTFKKASWTGRTSGDATTAPDPSFVNNIIRFVFFARGRLCFLSNDNVIMSAVGKDGFFRFYPETVRQVLDTDPIDIAATGTKVSYLKAAVEYDNKIILFGDRTNLVLQADGTFTQSSVSILPGTDYEADLKASPVSLGKTVAFGNTVGNWSSVSELYVDADTSKMDAADITSHVPSYIPSTIRKFAVNQKVQTLFVLPSSTPNYLYHYSWHWVGNEKVQAAWGRWSVPIGDTIVSVECYDSYVYLLITRAEGTFLERVDLQPFATDAGYLFKVRLDSRVSVTGVYNSSTKQTSWTLPAPVNLSTPLSVVLGPSFAGRVGDTLSSVSHPTTTTVVVSGDYSAGPVLIGSRYTSSITPSEIVLGQNTGNGRQPRLDGTLHLRSMLFSHAATGYYAVSITPRNSEPFLAEFYSRVIGDASATLGTLSLETGVFKTRPIGKASNLTIEISSDSHLPFAILGFSWEGNYATRTQKV